MSLLQMAGEILTDDPMTGDLDKFLDHQLSIAVALPDKVKSAFDREDLPLKQALDITASIRKSSERLATVLSNLPPNALDERKLAMVKKLQRIWSETYYLAQVGSDRLMSRNETKLAS